MENLINLSLIEPTLKASHVQFVGIFGSVAKGEAKATSDIDLLVRFSQPVSLLELIRLERLLAEKIGRKVDLVTEDSLDPSIKEEVLYNLKPIYERG